MTTWLSGALLFIAVAGGIGALCVLISNRRIGVLASAIVPWLLSLAWFGFREFYWPYEGSGVIVWFATQLSWGTVALFAGLAGYFIARRTSGKRSVGAF